MQHRRTNLMLFVVLLGLSASFVLITAFAQANPLSGVISEEVGITDASQGSASPEALPLRFPSGDWPWYAQGEIHLYPEPPMPGSPVEICVKVVNDDTQADHTAWLEFGAAPLGIGVPYNPIGSTEMLVPAGGHAIGCTMWITPEPGLWGIEVLLFQEDAQEPLRSLRNIDLWEPLEPGEAHDLIFQVGPLGAQGVVNFELTSYLPGWEVTVIPSTIIVDNPDEVFSATLRTIPPREVNLGSGLPIVDVEGFFNDQSIGGIRKVELAASTLARACRSHLRRARDNHRSISASGRRTDRAVRRAAQPYPLPTGCAGAILLGQLWHRLALHPHQWYHPGVPAAIFHGQIVHLLGSTSLRASMPASHPRNGRV